ncbi:MAG: cytochrome c [Acetobacteraceae bacterium]|nr:cytochrome c [Acetobacteraceae bacterium]
MQRFVLGFIVAILVLAAVGLAVVFTGAFNVAASVPHTGLETWVLSTTMRNSVRRHAEGIAVPASIGEDQVREGFAQYRQSCVYCHGGPGVDPADWAQGFTPEPPFLPDTVRRWRPQDLFWIVKNGIKMTAMPAFGGHLDDRQIWGVVGFIQRLPDMPAETYERLGREADQPAQPGGTGAPSSAATPGG